MKKFVLVIVLLLIAGCNNVVMSPAYQQTTTDAAIVVQELTKRCQSGDTEACKVGCQDANEVMQKLVNALAGKAE
jgi:hypothetical protein